MDSIGDCNSKEACNSPPFPCLVTSGGCDDSDVLEVVIGERCCKTTLLRIRRLVWARTMWYVCSKTLRERIWGVILEKKDEFSSFWVK